MPLIRAANSDRLRRREVGGTPTVAKRGRSRLRRGAPTQRNDRLFPLRRQQCPKRPFELRFWSPRWDSKPRPFDYESLSGRLAGALVCILSSHVGVLVC
jgi:hypothetical protein